MPDSRTCSVNGSPSDTHPAPTPKLGHQPRGGEEGSRSGLLLPHLSECHDNLENVIKPTWAYANEVHDCQIYRKLITELLGKQRQLWSKRLESILMQMYEEVFFSPCQTFLPCDHKQLKHPGPVPGMLIEMRWGSAPGKPVGSYRATCSLTQEIPPWRQVMLAYSDQNGLTWLVPFWALKAGASFRSLCCLQPAVCLGGLRSL